MKSLAALVVCSGATLILAAALPTVSAEKHHWAFQSVQSAALPTVRDTAWVKTPVDQFILAKLEADALKPSPPAARETLIRRVTLDLIGLPPTPEETDTFMKDHSPAAFEYLVDRLLASPH